MGQDLPNHLGARLARRGWIKPVWHEFQPGLWMQLRIQDMTQETILLEDVWDPQLTEFIRENLGPQAIFIDVGANVGYFTLIASVCVGASGKVLAIEPNPSVAEQLRVNVQRSNLSNVITEEALCSDSVENHTETLYLPDESSLGKASLSKSNAGGLDSVKVRSATLDQLIFDHRLQGVMFVKIDVEGAELMVLRGMTETLARLRPIVVIELVPDLLANLGTSKDEVIAFLTSFSYSTVSLGGHENYVSRPT
ncbi:MAG TPA: FkbM family methyltransferase [Pyrinomonadaceae bacterium]